MSKDCHPFFARWVFNLSASCIAISGLGSHPFGSWQSKGVNTHKPYMWILDNLVHPENQVRVILYGYDTRLQDSLSFQNIQDLATSLIEQLHINRGTMCKTPLAFLAHSLGGLVVKQAMVYLADEQSYGTEYQPLRDAIRGAIFFGVPSQGMDVSDWKAIVQGNPNENMIRNLSIESDFISKLTESFNGIWNERCKFFWAYEQLMSRQVNVCDRHYTRYPTPIGYIICYMYNGGSD